MTKPKFTCTHRELYTVCASGWESCNQNLEKFTSFRPVYTAAFVEARINDLNQVKAIPHKTKRTVTQELARTELKNKLNQCLDAWRKLKLTIPDLWPEDQHEAHYKDMGSDFYLDCIKMKWESCTGMMDSAMLFIQKHSALL
ncbi:MAG: hypothetical protein V4615_00270, partial [Bacteroidota bacterium]